MLFVSFLSLTLMNKDYRKVQWFKLKMLNVKMLPKLSLNIGPTCRQSL